MKTRSLLLMLIFSAICLVSWRFFPGAMNLFNPSSAEAKTKERRPENLEYKGPKFSFHLMQEPHRLDPALYRSSASSYFFSNLFRGLYKYSNDNGLVAEGAKSCTWQNPLQLKCELNQTIKWSDGTPVVAKDYIRGFKHLLNPKTTSPRADLLFRVKNAKDIFLGKKDLDQLDVKTPNQYTLIFNFSKPDREFLYKLSSNALIPRKQIKTITRKNVTELASNGPYKLTSWTPGQKIELASNDYYPFGGTSRPPVTVYFIEDDKTALRFYKSGKLKFLRRLPSGLIPAYKDRADFLQLPIARFDYVGFGPQLAPYFHLRKALALSLNYQQMKDLYKALGRPGCPSIPESYMDQVVCHDHQLDEARKSLTQFKKLNKVPRLEFAFSKLGGEDIRKGMEWIQNQWYSKLQVKTSLSPVEQGLYLNRLNTNPPSIFRKGVGLDRPTCLAALETFSKNGSDNFIQLNRSDYEKIIVALEKETRPDEQKKLCRKGVQVLLDNYLLIPMGRIHFSMLVDPKFKGWRLNEMNQLDLTHLQYVKNQL